VGLAGFNVFAGKEIRKRLRKAQINRLPEQPGDVPLTCANISKARRLLSYNPTTPLKVGLQNPLSGSIVVSCSDGL
jgi:nucleoside-diphosphate-sugar epimerase